MASRPSVARFPQDDSYQRALELLGRVRAALERGEGIAHTPRDDVQAEVVQLVNRAESRIAKEAREREYTARQLLRHQVQSDVDRAASLLRLRRRLPPGTPAPD
jgi:hypothetical protein